MLDPLLGILFLLLSAGLPPAHRHVQGSGSPPQGPSLTTYLSRCPL